MRCGFWRVALGTGVGLIQGSVVRLDHWLTLGELCHCVLHLRRSLGLFQFSAKFGDLFFKRGDPSCV
jgi:hypothetical protein